MNPPNLAYRRTIRQSGDVQTTFIPSCDPQQREIFNTTSYIYLLTDLFLLCERVSPADGPANPQADMWLLYPPLATKHLKVKRIDDNDHVGNSFEVEIMRKERITVFVDSREKREEWMESFQDAIGFVNPSGLHVNTDVSRSASPASATSATSGVASIRSNTFSPQSWQSSNGPSPLPSLPLSASTPQFPSNARSQNPNGSMSPRRLPEAPGFAPYQSQNGRDHSYGQQSLPPTPTSPRGPYPPPILR